MLKSRRAENYLALDDEGVEELARVVDGEVLQQLHHARLAVHLDEGDVVPERVGVALRRVGAVCEERRLHPARDGVSVVGEGRHLGELELLRRQVLAVDLALAERHPRRRPRSEVVRGYD